MKTANSNPSPVRALVLWALLIPVANAPHFILGRHVDTTSWALLGVALVLATLSILLFARTESLDRIARGVEPRAGLILALIILVYVAASTAIVQERLGVFSNYGQFALYGQSYWTLLHGWPFSNSAETMDGSLASHLGTHFSPTLLLLTPLYALYPAPIVLAAAQALAVALITVPIFHLLRRDAGPTGATVLSLAVLAVPSFFWAGANDLFDFHFLPVLLLCAFLALERRRAGLFLLAACAALGVREDTSMAVVMLGGYALLRGYGVRVALGIVALGAVWMASVVVWVMPHFRSDALWSGPAKFFASYGGLWGSTPIEAVKTMLMHPMVVLHALVNAGSARYFHTILSPLLLLPPLMDPVWIVGIPALVIMLLAPRNLGRLGAPIYATVPRTFFALATARTAARLAGHVPPSRRAGFGLAIGLVVLAGTLPWLAGTGSPQDELSGAPIAPVGPARAVLRSIPPGAAVYAPPSLLAPLCNRERLGCWQGLLERGRDPYMRARYEYFVLWPDADPPGLPHDRQLADSLAGDLRFARLSGFEPFLVYRRR